MTAAQFQFQRTVAAFQQALQLGHALARDDDLALGSDRLFQGCFAQSQAVAVGGHTAQGLFAQVEQQPVEVIADVLLGHREGGALDQFLEPGLGNAHAVGGLELVDRGKVVRRQAR